MGARAEESRVEEWREIPSLDYSPRKRRIIEYTDYKYKDFVICDYVDSFHVFRKHKYIIRTQTLRQAKRVVRWLEGEHFPTPRKNKMYVLRCKR